MDHVTHFRENNLKNLQNSMIYFKVKGILTKAVTFDEFTRLNIT